MACKRTVEYDLECARVTVQMKLDTKYKLLAMTHYKMTLAKAVHALCVEAVKDVPITDKEEKAIKAERAANYDKRMANRIRIAAQNAGLSEEAYLKRQRG